MVAALAGASGWICAAAAEVATDGSLGRKVRLDGKDVRVGAELGRVRGKNLFHSFERFGVEKGGRVTFAGPAGLDNVISRVTGGERSTIDGTLASEVAGADVWLVNPAGIVFGPDARLDVPAGLHVSTADELRFLDGARFSARDLGGSTLSVAKPEAFGFLGGGRPGAISIDRSALGLRQGEALSLVGGDVTITGGPEAFILAEAGRVAIGALHGRGAFDLASGGAAGPGGDVVLTDAAIVKVSGDGAGTVRVRAGSLLLEGGSAILADNEGTADASGGVDIVARRVTIGPGSQIASDALASGDAGTVNVRADESLLLRGDAFISSSTFGDGDSRSVTIIAGRLSLKGGGRSDSAPAITSTAEQGSGDAGDVRVTADAVELRNVATINSATFTSGVGGTVTVNAGRVVIVGTGGEALTAIMSQADPGSSGSAGDVRVVAEEIELRNGGRISGSTAGSGRAGSVVVEAGRLFAVGGAAEVFTGVQSRAVEKSSGDGGDVTVRAREIELRDEGEISTGTLAIGNAGVVTVTAERVLIVGNGESFFTSIDSRAQEGASGNAGSVFITADEIELRRQGTLGSDSAGSGRAGDVSVKAGRLKIEDRGRIGSSNTGDGPAGNVIVRATRIDIDGGDIRTEGNNAEGGRIEVEADDLIHLLKADISSNGIMPQASRSLVTLQAPTIVLNASRVTSLTGTGAPLPGSGEARLLGDVTVISADSLVAASSSVETTGLQADLGSRLRVSASAFLDAVRLLGQGCAARRAGGEVSSFTRQGRGGLPPSPERPLASTAGRIDGQALRPGGVLQAGSNGCSAPASG